MLKIIHTWNVKALRKTKRKKVYKYYCEIIVVKSMVTSELSAWGGRLQEGCTAS